MMPTEGPNATYNFPVILHGGPKDGTIMSLDYLVHNAGRITVAIAPGPEFYAEMFRDIGPGDMHPIAVVPIKTGTYVRQRKHAGEPHTCEYREWYEWHWVE